MRRVIAGALASLILVGCSSAGTTAENPTAEPAGSTPKPTLKPWITPDPALGTLPPLVTPAPVTPEPEPTTGRFNAGETITVTQDGDDLGQHHDQRREAGLLV